MSFYIYVYECNLTHSYHNMCALGFVFDRLSALNVLDKIKKIKINHNITRRALAAQQEARVKEVMTQAKSMQSVMSVSRKALQQIHLYEHIMKHNNLASNTVRGNKILYS